MIRPGKAIIAGIAALLACGSLLADPATNANGWRLSLADVVRLVGDRNPRVLAERETVAAARAERRIAGAYPNPKATFGQLRPANGEHTIFTGDRQQEATIEIPVLIPGQRSSRVAKADADVGAAEARFAAGNGILAGEACLSFTRLLALQETGHVLAKDFAEVTRMKNIVAGRLAEGNATAYDLTRVEVELGVLGSRLEGVRSEIAAEASQLASLLGLTNGLPAAIGPLQAWNLPPGTLHNSGPDTSAAPLVVAATREAEAAEAGIKAASRSRWPELSIDVGRMWTRRPFGSADSVALNIEIPLFDTHRGQVDKAKSEARAAEARRRAVVAEVDAVLYQLIETVERRQSALDRHRTDLEPRLARLKEMSTDAYALGRHSLLELLDAQQARREVTLDGIETTRALVEAQIRFLTATGRLLSFLTPNREPQSDGDASLGDLR